MNAARFLAKEGDECRPPLVRKGMSALSGIGIPFYMLWTGESVVLAHILCEVVA